MKTPKFLICSDPLNEESTEMLLHSHRPRFLAQVTPIPFDEIENRPEKSFADALYVNSEGVMEIYRISIVDMYDRAEEEDIQDELFPATDYFCKYLQLMEKEEGVDPGFPVKDFNDELPGLKILHAPDLYTVVYNGLVAEFGTEEEMDEFLESELNIESDLLDKGVINQFE
ncbi:MAG: hypothetical protein M1292_12825 [Bacteroidetes bacterium]|nr:hypothetical protein [Bacteroidota bacterium]